VYALGVEELADDVGGLESTNRSQVLAHGSVVVALPSMTQGLVSTAKSGQGGREEKGGRDGVAYE